MSTSGWDKEYEQDYEEPKKECRTTPAKYQSLDGIPEGKTLVYSERLEKFKLVDKDKANLFVAQNTLEDWGKISSIHKDLGLILLPNDEVLIAVKNNTPQAWKSFMGMVRMLNIHGLPKKESDSDIENDTYGLTDTFLEDMKAHIKSAGRGRYKGNQEVRKFYFEGDSPLINLFNVEKYLTRYKNCWKDGGNLKEKKSEVLKMIHYLMFEYNRISV